VSDAAILAGGRGTRLGGVDKALLEIGGAAILDRQLAAIRGAVDRVAVVAPDPGALARAGVEPVIDPGAGPLAALVCALEWCATDRLVVIAGDLPFADAAAIELLEGRAGDADLVAPVIGGVIQVLFALYRVAAVIAPARELADAGAGPRRLFDRPGLAVRAISEAECRAALGGVDFALGVNDARDVERANQIVAARE
jgi:molybdopterin-guanine dinucleotide biosynthesis protein A